MVRQKYGPLLPFFYHVFIRIKATDFGPVIDLQSIMAAHGFGGKTVIIFLHKRTFIYQLSSVRAMQI